VSEEKVEVPPHVKAFAEALHLEIVGTPREVKPPGYAYPCWEVPVRDEGTGEVIRILNAYPIAEVERYKMVDVTNKLGYAVRVLTYREDVKKVETPMPTAEEVRDIREQTRVAIPPPPAYHAPANWRFLRDLAGRIKRWIPSMERHMQARRAMPVHAYLHSIQDWLSSIKHSLTEAAPEVTEAIEKREEPVITVLRPEDREALWEQFAKRLQVARLDPEAYRERFERALVPSLNYEENLWIIQDEAGKILEEELLRKKRYVDKLVVPKVFSWKVVGWGLASLKLSTDMLIEACERKDALTAYTTVARMLETSEKMKKILALHPHIKEYELGKR